MKRKQVPINSQNDTHFAYVSNRLIDYVIELVKNDKKLAFQANILEIASDAIIAFDANHNITYINPAAELMYGWTAAEAISISPKDILNQIYSEEEDIAVIRTKFNLPQSLKGEFIHHRKDGSPFWVEYTSRPYFDKNGSTIGYVAVVHDINARKHAENNLKAIKDQLTQELAIKNRLHSIRGHSVTKSNLHEVLNEIIETVIEFTNADMCSIHLLDDNSSKIKVVEYQGFDSSFVDLFISSHSDSEISCEMNFKLMNRIIVEDVTKSDLPMITKNIHNILSAGIRAVQITPLITRSNHLLGVLSTCNKVPHKLDEQENILLDMLARLISDIIEHIEFEINKELLIKSEKEKNEALQKAIEMKDEFLSLISHEFKTPLTVINSAIQAMELLCKDELSPRSKGFLRKIRQNSYRQLRLVNNLLDITRYNSGQMKIHKTNKDIIFLTKSITDSVQIYAEQKGLSLTFSSTIKRREIGIDEEKYERILLNLLSNAIKFTKKGNSITVHISQKIVDGRCMVCIAVKDSGIGIPKDKVNIIFERFGQVDNSLSRQAEGTGIGLSLVKMLVESQGGLITVHSKVGCGSSFIIMFPAKKTKVSTVEPTINEFTDNRLIQATAVEFSDIYL